MNERVVGVLGGMGPDATVDFMAKVIAVTPAEEDQDHIRMLIDHDPTVPNRQAAILRDGEDPSPALADMARRLERAGADFLAIPCNTAYVFAPSIIDAVRIPLVSIIDVSIDALPDGCSRAGLLATDGCIRARVYQDAMDVRGVAAVLPTDEEMIRLMELIGRIKGGDQAIDVSDGMRDLADALVARGAGAVIAGCTEIPLVLDASSLDVPLISSTDVLAERTVQYARGEVALPQSE